MSFRVPRSRYRFQAVSDWFVYTNPSVQNDSLPAIADDFGLEKNRSWKALTNEVRTLNGKSSETKEHYKLIYAARHGEGDHNVAEAKYGTQAWDAHWSLLTGDEEGNVWGPDPELTVVGKGQAREAAARWRTALLRPSDPPPMPTKFFSSPLLRSAQTLQLSFDGIAWPDSTDIMTAQTAQMVAATKERPTILECLRENFSDRHTCDQRSSRTTIEKRWKPLGWHVDADMDDEDTLFASSYVETEHAMTQRLSDALSVVWSLSDGHDVVNITSHSGAMQSLFRAVGHDDFKPKTGGTLSPRMPLSHFKLTVSHVSYRYGPSSDKGNRDMKSMSSSMSLHRRASQIDQWRLNRP